MDELEIKIDPGADPVEAWRQGSLALARALGLGISPLGKAALGKAVVGHHSQVQQRSGQGQFQRREPHHLIPRGPGGQFRQRLTRAECQEAAAAAGSLVDRQLRPRLSDHLADYQAGHLPAPRFRARVARELEHFYEQLYRAGKQAVGDPGVRISPTDRALLNRMVRDELGYLDGFTAAMEAGEGVILYARRMQFYADAAWEAFWHGWVMGDLRPGRKLRWRLGVAEHCRDCLRFSELGWLPIIDFVDRVLRPGYAPRSGNLECRGLQCKCALAEFVDGQQHEPAVGYLE